MLELLCFGHMLELVCFHYLKPGIRLVGFEAGCKLSFAPAVRHLVVVVQRTIGQAECAKIRGRQRVVLLTTLGPV